MNSVPDKTIEAANRKQQQANPNMFIELAPTDLVTTAPTSDDLQHTNSKVSTSAVIHNPLRQNKDKKNIDYYEYRHVVADGVQKALDECRQKFKWDRWNCPKKAFLSILDREEFSMGQTPLPSNKELGLTRALIASSIVLSMIRSCSIGSNSMCSCTNPVIVPIQNGDVYQMDQVGNGSPGSTLEGSPAHYGNHDMYFDQPDPMNAIERRKRFVEDDAMALSTQEQAVRASIDSVAHSDLDLLETHPKRPGKFAWAGCDEIVKFGFKVARMYLDTQDGLQGEAGRLINSHNYEAGRQAVKKSMRRRCKCHGTSGTCQVNTCWTVVPDISEVGDYLKRQYRVAAKVGAVTANETDVASLVKELAAISPDKLVFADASPDYCYESKQLGINGTLGRYCSRSKHRHDGSDVSRSERDSCDRLCTKCGYKIKKERINVEKQCDCRFVYCCSVECKRCPHVEETYKCVRHS